MAQLLRLVLIASAASFADGIKLSANPASCQRVQCTKSQRIVMKGSSRFRKELAAMDDWERGIPKCPLHGPLLRRWN
jgi:hypothetical protein